MINPPNSGTHYQAAIIGNGGPGNRNCNHRYPTRTKGLSVIKTPLITTLLVVLVVHTAHSHDCWLYPERFTLEKGDRLIVRQRFGHELRTDLELALDKDYTTRFELITTHGTVDLLEEAPERSHPRFSPVLTRKMDFEGLGLLVMDHDFETIELSYEAFSRHLEYEELKEIQKQREQNEPKPSERERYARAVKSLVRVGENAEGDLYKQIVGQKIEIVLLQNPFVLDPGDDLEVRVLFDGAPLPGKLVWAQNGTGERLVSQSKVRTDERGIALFRIDGEGLWLIRLVHTLPCTDCHDADWESYWASFSFELD